MTSKTRVLPNPETHHTSNAEAQSIKPKPKSKLTLIPQNPIRRDPNTPSIHSPDNSLHRVLKQIYNTPPSRLRISHHTGYSMISSNPYPPAHLPLPVPSTSQTPPKRAPTTPFPPIPISHRVDLPTECNAVKCSPIQFPPK
ncbi:hypothetical protein M422DRAFT_39763, partial [Sphaerobolus stellatus SS14]